ncbi:MAG: FAD-dependent oxidoreductase [Rhodococcus sp. (in: high G+C Gram-positive bacteria)]
MVAVSGVHPVPSVAVVGSGPSGCYTAQFLRKAWPSASIVVFESLPAPYGLVRYGVAADHQGNKAVVRQFDRLFERSDVAFVGNVTIGKDLTMEELESAFDVVVLAVGLQTDRPLPVPLETGARVVGAGRLLRAFNGYPGLASELSEEVGTVGEHLAVVGMGNVAMDVLRLMSKETAQLDGSDIDDDALASLRPRPVRTIDVLGRVCQPRAACDLSMLRELKDLPHVNISIKGLRPDDCGPIVDLLTEVAEPAATLESQEYTQINFNFGVQVQKVDCREGRTVVHAVCSTGEQQEFSVDTVVTAIGFQCNPETDHNVALKPNQKNVRPVGWFRRGPTGAIGANRRCAQQVSEQLVADVESSALSVGRAGLSDVWPKIADRAVSFADWQRIDTYETAQAPEARRRRKVTSLGQMLEIATQR